MKKVINLKKQCLKGVLMSYKENKLTLNQVINFIEDEYKKELRSL